MQQLYGEDWRTMLEEQQAAEEEEGGADVESVTAGERSAEQSVASASAGLAGSATTSQILRQTLSPMSAQRLRPSTDSEWIWS